MNTKEKSSFDERNFFDRLKHFEKDYDKYRYSHWTYNSIVNLVVIIFLIIFEIVGNYTYLSAILTDAPYLMVFSISALACCSQIGPSFAAVAIQEYLFKKQKTGEKDLSKLIVFWCGLAAFTFVFIFVTVFQFSIADAPFTIDNELVADVPVQAPKLYAMLISAGRLATSVFAFGMTMNSYDPKQLKENADWIRKVESEAIRTEAEAGKIELSCKEYERMNTNEEKLHPAYNEFLAKETIAEKAKARQILAEKPGTCADGIEEITNSSIDLTENKEK